MEKQEKKRFKLPFHIVKRLDMPKKQYWTRCLSELRTYHILDYVEESLLTFLGDGGAGRDVVASAVSSDLL